MFKKIAILLLTLVLVVVVITPQAWAALTEEQQQKIDALHQRIDQSRHQLIDLYLEAGLITEEQAQLATERIELQKEQRTEYGCGLGIGLGKGKHGMGRGQGMGTCIFRAPVN